jgi:hypothetical protein
VSAAIAHLAVKHVRYVWTFFICTALAVLGVVLWLVTIIPRGEGAFGIAKMVPFLFLLGSIIVFCVIWFPANLGVFLWQRRQRGSVESKTVVVFSGCVFALCLTAVGTKCISAWHQAHSPQAKNFPPPQRQVELKDVKGLIDGFCARERRGEKLTPADGIFATMEQLMWLSPPDVVEYTADNLDDRSGFLWVIAGSPHCTPRLFDRFLSVPSTHRFLAANPAASPQVLETLSHSTNSPVRERVAANRKSPELVLRQLAADPDQSVRDSANWNLNHKDR